MNHSSFVGMSPTAQFLERTQSSIFERYRQAVTVSRHDSLDSIFEVWQAADEEWKVVEGEQVISENVMETACRFVQTLPLGFPLPSVTGEPDGHINLEWYRNPRNLLTVSVGPENRLYWAALIGSEDPRGSCRFVDRIPKTLLYYIARVFGA
jgi:hypothetical protein